MALLAKGKRLRGSWADLFGRTAERMAERRLRDEYLDQIEALSARVDAATLPLATAIADLPGMIRVLAPSRRRPSPGIRKSARRCPPNLRACRTAGRPDALARWPGPRR